MALAFAQLNKQNLNLSVYYDNNYSFTPSAPMEAAFSTDSVVFQTALSVFENEWVFKNMRIYPIVANDNYKEESEKNKNYLSLKEALDKGVDKAVIVEFIHLIVSYFAALMRDFCYAKYHA